MKTPEDVQRLREWVRVVGDYLAGLLGHPLLAEEMLRITRDVRTERQVRSMVRELRDHINALSPRQREQLDAFIAQRFGRSPDVDADARNRIQQILERGKIKTQEEARAVIARIDEIYADDACAEETEKLNALLGDYERP